MKSGVDVCAIQVGVWADSRWNLVVLHADRHLVLHGQPGGVPDRRAHAVAHRVGGRLR